jgi:CBS domain-containing protein
VVFKDGAVLGYVDMLDIVSFIVKVSPDEWCISHDCLRSLDIAGRAIALETISEIINASGRDPYVPVYENDPVTEAINHFARGIHRIVVVDRNGIVKHSLSQSDLAKLLSEELKKSPSKHISEKSIKDLGLGSYTPLTISETDTVLNALKKINENSVSALAIVHKSGKLGGNFSATDLVGLYRNHLPDLLIPLNDYLAKYSEKSLSPITIRSETTLLEAVQVMAESHIHRVWVIDDDFQPIGVLSLTDVARFIQTYVYE